MQSHQFKSQPDEDYLPVKWQNYESKELQLTMTTSLSKRTLELNLFLLLLELGLISASAVTTLKEEDSTRAGGSTTPGHKLLSTLSSSYSR